MSESPRFRSVEMRAAEDLGEGVLVAYATTWDDPYKIGRNSKEQIKRGAFDTQRAVPYLWEHSHGDVPIGVTRSITEDDKGLRIEVEMFLDDPRARSVWRSIKAGAVLTNSIGFIPEEIVVTRSGDEDLETIVRGELLEVSAVLKPANPSAETVSTRAVVPAAVPGAPAPVDPTTGMPVEPETDEPTKADLLAEVARVVQMATDLGMADALPKLIKSYTDMLAPEPAPAAPAPEAAPVAPAPVPRSLPSDLSPSLFRALTA